MKKKLPYLLSVAILLSVLAAVAYRAANTAQGQPVRPLENYLLRPGDLPEDSTALLEPTIVNSFPGPSSPRNLSFKSPGFVSAYTSSFLYPAALKDGETGLWHVENTVYQFNDPALAKSVLNDQVKMEKNYANPDYMDVIEVTSLDSVVARNGSILCTRYSLDNYDKLIPMEGDPLFETCYFQGIKDNVLILLIVDGIYTPEATSQQIVKALAALSLQN